VRPEAADQQWSTRQLERRIPVLYYERLLASRKKAPVRKEAAAAVEVLDRQQDTRRFARSRCCGARRLLLSDGAGAAGRGALEDSW
jgi:hypothetical protein